MKKPRSTMERALEECLDRLNFAAETAGLGFWEWDPRAGRLTADDHTTNLFALPRRKTKLSLAAAFAAVVHQNDREAFCAAVQRASDCGEQANHYCRMLRNDGSVRHVDARFKVMRSARGVAQRIVVLTKDITEQIEREELFKERAAAEHALVERLSIATQAAGIYVWEYDYRKSTITWDEHRLTGAASKRHFGQELGSEVFKFVHPEDLGIGAASMAAALKRGEPDAEFKYRLRLPDGTIRHIQAYARTSVDAEGKPLRSIGVSWDITREVQAAEETSARIERERQLQERLSVAGQAAGLNCWEFSYATGNFTWFDRLPDGIDVDKLGIEKATETLNSSFLSEDVERVRDEAIRALGNGEQTMTTRMRRRSSIGTLQHIEMYQRFFRDASGRPTHAVGASRDITEEVRAAEEMQRRAEELRDAQRRLERASLSVLEGHWEIDLLTGKHWVSSNYYRLLGYLPDEIDLSNTEQLERNVHPDDIPWSKEEAQNHIDTGAPYDLELRVKVKNGEYRWFRVRGNAERDANGNAIRLSGAIHDIQKQRMAEEELKVARQRFERAIRGTQDGLWEWDIPTKRLWMSPRYEAILGFEENELNSLQMSAEATIHHDDLGAWRAAQRAHSEDDAPFDVEVRMRTKSGEYRWIRVRGRAERGMDNRPLRVSGSIQDVTEARSARDALIRASEAAQAANRAKSAFLANVSHEIRTPMNGIIGMTSLLLDTPLEGQQHDYAETIRSSADSLLTVINDILDFSKIEAGKLDIDMLEMDLPGNVEDIGSIMAFQAAGKNLEFIVHVHPDVPELVMGDPQRIRQCLINMVGNAIKFTRAGEIVAEVSKVGQRDGMVLTRFEVRDTGIGIAPETIRTLFQPFVQADASTTRHFGGTGLGLSIVRRLVEMMGGEVGAASEVGKGSTFWFTLPMRPVESLAASPRTATSGAGKRILVVDDNATNRRVLDVQLTRAGYRVALAPNGDEALRALHDAVSRSEPFDLVLADFQMPGLDGAMLGERIRSDRRLENTRIVLLTSMDRQGDQRNFAAQGIAGFLPKPVRPRELFKCLDKVLAVEAAEWHGQSEPIVTQNRLHGAAAAATRYSGNVLLVEDNLVNQKVARKFLERLGCTVSVAENGADGIRAWESGDYKLVLMDVQMPVMDGYTATRQIREREGSRPRIPIIALTANAMTGQLERCLEAGMDGLLTKPLDVDHLQDVLDRHGFALSTPGPAAAPASAAPVHTIERVAPLDFAQLLDATAQDHEFAYDLAQSYVANCREVLGEIRASIAKGDRERLARAAHSLKGASANVYAKPLCELGGLIEKRATGLSTGDLERLVLQLVEEIDRVQQVVRGLSAPASRSATN